MNQNKQNTTASLDAMNLKEMAEYATWWGEVKTHNWYPGKIGKFQ